MFLWIKCKFKSFKCNCLQRFFWSKNNNFFRKNFFCIFYLSKFLNTYTIKEWTASLCLQFFVRMDRKDIHAPSVKNLQGPNHWQFQRNLSRWEMGTMSLVQFSTNCRNGCWCNEEFFLFIINNQFHSRLMIKHAVPFTFPWKGYSLPDS